MSKPHDDLDAVKIISNELEKFEGKDQERILRWVVEKMGINLIESVRKSDVKGTQIQPAISTAQKETTKYDIKSFIDTKKPITDKQLAVTVAYFYKFEAPVNERKDTINSQILLDACRLSGRERLRDPGQTLINASFSGLLDKAAEKGYYSINTVGENLVAMTLPSSTTGKKGKVGKTKKKKGAKQKSKKKSTNRKSNKK